jgi:GMP synthase-like glutamine amidotransferase
MTKPPLRIGVLETGRPPEDLAPEFGDYPSMVADWLSPLAAETTRYASLDGNLPTDPAECDLWVVTGSKFGVYEAHDWIPPLEQFIRDIRDAGRKMVGICFGHQLIAQALGGVVNKSAKGWALGVHQYETVNWPAPLGTDPGKIVLQAYHQDQVDVIPDGAIRIAQSDFCPNAALWYPGFAVTVQGHPEFAKPYTSALLESRRGTILSDADVDQGQRNMALTTNRNQLAVLIRNGLKSF